MTVPREDLLAKVRQWPAHADADLRLARLGADAPEPCPHHLIAYHAQQCVEKHLKAFLVLRMVDFPYTHDIFRLLAQCDEHGDWTRGLDEAGELTRYAVAARYPGEEEEVTPSEARRAIEIAERVRRAVRTAMAAEGVGPPWA